MKNNNFEDESKHPMSRRRLASFFFPDIDEDKAVRRLRQWINTAKLAKKELEAAGYQPRSREIFPPAIEVLRRWFGDPFH